jgi:hypothetical protein
MGMGAHIEGQIPGQELRLQIPVRPLFQQISGNAENKEGVTTAPGPDKVIDRSPADASVLAHVGVSKIVRIIARFTVSFRQACMT